MIDALFGSKTRVKLLYLFLDNPGQPFYVREITRKIDEQINSVRRELSNMLKVGIIISDDSSDNKLYYQVNQRYDYYLPLKAIFGNVSANNVNSCVPVDTPNKEFSSIMHNVIGLRLVIFAGVLVKGSTTDVDILFVGNMAPAKVKVLIKLIEKSEGREINYSVLSYDEFCYRLSSHDRFIAEIINGKHSVIIDKDKVLNKD